jgi:hypothetical protein
MKKSNLLLLFVATLALCTSSVLADTDIGAGTAADPAYYYAPTYYLGNGAFRSYIAIDHENEIAMALGIEFSPAFLIDPPVPTEEIHAFQLEIPLPDIAGVYTQFQSYETNWMPNGHPGSPFLLPHIDFHFYLQNKQSRLEGITAGPCGPEGASAESFCKGVQPLTALCCPPMYINPGLTVANMGSHLIDLLSPVIGGAKFFDTFIFGTWGGRLTFYEPMVTLEAFEMVINGTWPKTCATIRNPSRTEVAGMYPSQYCYFATSSGNVRLEMDNFVYIPSGCGDINVLGPATSTYDPTKDPTITLEKVKKCNDCPNYKYTKKMANDYKKKKN